MRWTDETLHNAIEILRANRELKTAIDEIGAMRGRRCTASAVYKVLVANGFDPPSNYLRPLITPASERRDFKPSSFGHSFDAASAVRSDTVPAPPPVMAPAIDVTPAPPTPPRAGKVHLAVPDTQVAPGVPLVHLDWVSRYIEEKRPDEVIHLGDHADMKSLSSYDKGKGKAEGRRYEDDIDAAIRGMEVLTKHWGNLPGYNPGRTMLLGNHEDRINRYADSSPELTGKVSTDDLKYQSFGFKVHEFLNPTEIDGIMYSHYFIRNANGEVVQSRRGAPNARQQVIREMRSCTAGHKQGLSVHNHQLQDKQIWGIIAGSCYLHDEGYLTPQGTSYWRGIIVKNEVHDGEYSPWFVSLDYLCRRYEGVPLAKFMTTATPREMMIAPGAPGDL